MSDRPADIRKFERAGQQRFSAAEFLLTNGYNLDATYLAGYSVECALKALILRRTPASKHDAMIARLTKVGALGHDFEYLKNVLQTSPCNCTIPVAITLEMRNVAEWSTNLRYETGLISLKDAARFLENVESIAAWAKRSS